jgi:dCTP deaminase
MLKNDRWITEQAAQGMLEPFQKGLVRHLDPEQQARPVLSFGCSSYGYDLRLSAQEFMIFSPCAGHGDESQALQSRQPRADAVA